MWLTHTTRQVARRVTRRSPFGGDITPTRVPLFARGRPSLPIPHPWNYQEPLRILGTYFHGAEDETGPGRHNRYFDVPGLPLGLVTRDPHVIRAVLSATGDKPGQFDRDQAPAKGIGRFTGTDTMLYSNGAQWRNQKRLAAPSFAKSTLFQPEKFHEFEATFRKTIMKRIDALARFQAETGERWTRIELEPEISAVMLEMLVNNFFGANVPYDELRERYVPAIGGLIGHMVRDTVGHQLISPLRRVTSTDRQVHRWRQDFEHLTDIALEGRREGKASWAQFKSDAPDAALRSNIRVFLAGALEATTSFASWTLSHLSYRPDIQDQIHDETLGLDTYDPDNLAQAITLNRTLEETLRLTPALYFLPRKATTDTWIETTDGGRLMIPKGTHVVLDVWHANRCDEFWGPDVTGYPAGEFHPDRWRILEERGGSPKDHMHFGFGYGARVCPGKFLGQLEVGLVVGAFVKVFRARAVHDHTEARAGVSTKPADGCLVELQRRNQ